LKKQLKIGETVEVAKLSDAIEGDVYKGITIAIMKELKSEDSITLRVSLEEGWKVNQAYIGTRCVNLYLGKKK